MSASSYRPFAADLQIQPSTPSGIMAHRLASRASLMYMIQSVMGVDIAPFHAEWVDRYLSHLSSYIASSRRHIKTTIAQLIAVWEVERRRTRVVIAMSSLPQTRDWVRGFTDYLMYYLQAIESDVKIVASNSVEIELSNGSVVYIRSLTGKFRGLNPDIIILDDLLDEYMNLSFEEGENIIRRVILSARLPHTRTLYVGTVLREGDALDKLRTGEFGSFVGDSYPAIHEDDWHLIDEWARWYHNARRSYNDYVQQARAEDDPVPEWEDWYAAYRDTVDTEPPRPRALWPQKYPLEVLMDWRADVGAYAFQVEFLLNPLSADQALVPPHLIDSCKDTRIVLDEDLPADSVVVAGMDVQSSPSSDADWSVITCLQVQDDVYTLCALDRFRGLRYDGQVSRLRTLHHRYDLEEVRIEKNFESFLVQIVEDLCPDLRVVPHTTGSRNKNDLQMGIPMLRTLFERKRLRIPWGDPAVHGAERVERTRRIMSILIHELLSWQYDPIRGKFVSKGRHDDTTMSLWFAVLAALDASKGTARFLTIDLEDVW